MKKFFGSIFFVGMLLIGTVLTAQAAVDCSSMKIVMISADATAGGNLWLRNDSGAACGSIANGAEQYFLFNPAEVDKLMAVGLTAVSLGKNVWVRAEGDAAGSYVSIMSINNH